MYLRLFIVYILSTYVMLSGCRDSANIPDVEEISLDNNWVRFEQELFAIDTNFIKAGIDSISKKYPSFTKLYFSQILPMGNPNEPAYYSEIKGFLTESSIVALKDTVEVVFKDFENVKKEMATAFRFLKYYFPEVMTPNVYTLISEYGYQRFLFSDDTRDGIGIGLDLFLGNDYPYKAIAPENPAFSNYLTRSFNKTHLVRNAVELLVDDFVGEAPGARMLDQMINNGKKLFILKKLLPESPDSVIYVYPHSKMEWVKANEIEIWSFFFNEDLFYETNMVKINKYINPSPNSPGMPDIAPGRTANYIGQKIVEAFMKRNSSLSIQELILERDHQKIMDQSRYKPKLKKK